MNQVRCVGLGARELIERRRLDRTFDRRPSVLAPRPFPTMALATISMGGLRIKLRSGACGDGEDPMDADRKCDPIAFLNQLTGAQPTHRTWFIDAEVCALRLVVQRTNGGPPVLREVTVVESASDVLRGASVER